MLPTFGVGAEGARLYHPAARRRPSGLGQYAFALSSHLTETSPLVSDGSRRQLMSEWGWHWNLSRPVLLEKTPTNMLTSRALQATTARHLSKLPAV